MISVSFLLFSYFLFLFLFWVLCLERREPVEIRSQPASICSSHGHGLFGSVHVCFVLLFFGANFNGSNNNSNNNIIICTIPLRTCRFSCLWLHIPSYLLDSLSDPNHIWKLCAIEFLPDFGFPRFPRFLIFLGFVNCQHRLRLGAFFIFTWCSWLIAILTYGPHAAWRCRCKW